MKKTLVALILASLLVITVVLPGSADSGASTGEATRLTILTYASASGVEELVLAFKPFEESHNCTIEIITSPLDQYDQKISTMIAGNQAPDALWCPEYSTPQYYYDGFAADLSAVKDDPAFNWDDFAKGQQNHYLYDGKIIGIPFSGQPLVLFYNKTLFEKAGLKTPTQLYDAGEWTVDAMLDSARKVADPASGVFGIDYTAGNWSNWDIPMNVALRLYGGAPWSTDYTAATINSAEALKGVQAYYDLIFVDNAHPMPGTIADFAAGNLGMVTTWFSRNEGFTETDFEWGVVPMPLNENGESSGYGGSAGYMVYSGGKNVELATEMVKFITSAEMMPKLRYVPTRISGITSDTYRQRSVGRVSDEAYAICLNEDVLAVTPVKPPHPQYAQCTQVIQKSLEAMYAQAMTPQQALDAMEEGLQPLMIQK